MSSTRHHSFRIGPITVFASWNIFTPARGYVTPWYSGAPVDFLRVYAMRQCSTGVSHRALQASFYRHREQ